MIQRTFVIGVGLTKFEKPGARNWDYPEMGREASRRALQDAGIDYSRIEAAYVGYCYGDSTCGQRVLYQLGLTSVPIINVNNNCATGSTALFLARQSVRHGIADCVLALGFEKMEKGSLRAHFADRSAPLEPHWRMMNDRYGITEEPFTAQLFGHAAREYMERYGVAADVFAKVAQKNHRHSVNNPYSQNRHAHTLEDVKASKLIFEPLTKLQCCPSSDGGAAAIIASERFIDEHNLWDRAVEIAGQSMTTDPPDSFDGSCLSLVGVHMTRAAAAAAYAEAELGPQEAQVIELHDCFSPNEVFSYEALGLCAAGAGAALVETGATTYGGKWVVNPSGGLLSKGHPLGATGLAQCAELTWQLRGAAEGRQVNGARVAIQHNAGLGGVAVVTVYSKPQGT